MIKQANCIIPWSSTKTTEILDILQFHIIMISWNIRNCKCPIPPNIFKIDITAISHWITRQFHYVEDKNILSLNPDSVTLTSSLKQTSSPVEVPSGDDSCYSSELNDSWTQSPVFQVLNLEFEVQLLYCVITRVWHICRFITCSWLLLMIFFFFLLAGNQNQH